MIIVCVFRVWLHECGVDAFNFFFFDDSYEDGSDDEEDGDDYEGDKFFHGLFFWSWSQICAQRGGDFVDFSALFVFFAACFAEH